jgi:AcrR family transcriptional regulator
MSKIVASKNGTKKDAIILKAAALFRKKGFAVSSMRELAENIGVEAASLYNHIGSKNELLQSICFKVANDFIKHLTEIEKKPLSVTQKIEQIVRFHIHMMLEAYDEVYVANHEWKQLKEPFLSNFLNQRKQYETRLIELVTLGISKKEFKKINPHVAVFTILSAVRGLELWQRQKKVVSIAEVEKNMLDHLLNGIAKNN